MNNDTILLMAFTLSSFTVILMMFLAWKDGRKKPIITWFCIWLLTLVLYLI
jgi:hypothetical protein